MDSEKDNKLDSNFKTLERFAEDYWSKIEEIVNDVETVSKFLQECESMIDTMKPYSDIVSFLRCLQSICCLDYTYDYGYFKIIDDSFLASAEGYIQKAIDLNSSEVGFQVMKLLFQRLRCNKEDGYQQQLEISEAFKVIDKDKITIWKKDILVRYVQVSWDVLYNMSKTYEEKQNSFHSVLCAKLILELDNEYFKVWACYMISNFYIDNESISEGYVYAKQGADLLDWNSEVGEDDMFVKAWKNCIHNVCYCLLIMDREEIDLKYFFKDAEFGENTSMYYIGLCYKDGNGVEKNNNLAYEWFKRAYEHGFEDAKRQLDNKDEKDQDYKKQRCEDAIATYQKILEQGGCIPYSKLALCYDKLKDYVNAFKYFLKAAENGNEFAKYCLGMYCYRGTGTEQDYKKAAEWFQTAAEKGNHDAQFALGCLYIEGNGVEQNYESAVYWYKKSAEQGDIDAQYNLGVCYYRGEGTEQDYKKAAEWFQTAAEKGNHDAQFILGCQYEEGNGVEQNYESAVYWYKKSAEQENEKAKEALRRLVDKSDI